MNKKEKIFIYGLPAFLGIIIGFLIVKNFKSTTFFDASLTTCISLSIAVGVTFLLSQRQTDRRKQKDILLTLLSSIQMLINDKTTYEIDANTEIESLTMRKREISNKINILIQYMESFGIRPEVEFLQTKFKEYDETIGNHINDLEHLKKAKKELRRPLELMDSKIFEIMLKLYT